MCNKNIIEVLKIHNLLSNRNMNIPYNIVHLYNCRRLKPHQQGQQEIRCGVVLHPHPRKTRE